jgi:3-oxoacyl-[acyl-carrier-protein] synthase II
LGLVSPFGDKLSDFFQHILNGESAVGLFRIDELPRVLAIPFVSCPGFDANAILGKALAGTMDRFAQLGTAAAFAAWDDAGLGREQGVENRENWGVAWGTALGGTLAYEKGYRELWQKGRERISPLSVILGMNNAANAHISIQLGLGGVSMSHGGLRFVDHRHRRGLPSGAQRRGADHADRRFGRAAGLRRRARMGGPARHGQWRRRLLPPPVVRSAPTEVVSCSARAVQRWYSKTGSMPLPAGRSIHAEIVGYGTTCDHAHLVRPGG